MWLAIWDCRVWCFLHYTVTSVQNDFQLCRASGHERLYINKRRGHMLNSTGIWTDIADVDLHFSIFSFISDFFFFFKTEFVISFDPGLLATLHAKEQKWETAHSFAYNNVQRLPLNCIHASWIKHVIGILTLWQIVSRTQTKSYFQTCSYQFYCDLGNYTQCSETVRQEQTGRVTPSIRHLKTTSHSFQINLSLDELFLSKNKITAEACIDVETRNYRC